MYIHDILPTSTHLACHRHFNKKTWRGYANFMVTNLSSLVSIGRKLKLQSSLSNNIISVLNISTVMNKLSLAYKYIPYTSFLLHRTQCTSIHFEILTVSLHSTRSGCLIPHKSTIQCINMHNIIGVSDSSNIQKYNME